MKNSTLKSCPFCGSDEAMMLPPTCNEESAYNPTDRSHPVVRCMECCAEAVGSDWDHDGDSAIAAWNDRPETAAPTAAEPASGDEFARECAAAIRACARVYFELKRRGIA